MVQDVGLFILIDAVLAIMSSVRFAIPFTILFMIVYRFYSTEIGEDTALGEHQGVPGAVRDYIHWIKTDRQFRNVTWLTFFVTILLFRTLFVSYMEIYPLSNLMGYWTSYEEGEVFIELVVNMWMFIPVIYMIFICYHDRLIRKKSLWSVLVMSFCLALGIALALETLQVMVLAGAWMLSDIISDIFGGIIGGLAFWMYNVLKKLKTYLQEKSL